MRENKKSEKILLKIAKSEKEEIKVRANELGMGMSSYIRKMTLNQRIIIKTDKDMIRQIKYVGNNINQIAHQFNMRMNDVHFDEFFIQDAYKQMEEYKQILECMLNSLTKK